MKKQQQGFTLIELLVVIAIIGILASVVLASLNSARAKGADAATKENLDNIRAQAEIVYDNNGQNYTTVCNDSTVQSAVQSALTASGDTGTVATRCYSGQNNWVAWSSLKTPGAGYWCVDNTGVSKNEPSGTAMPSSAIPCP